MLKNLGIKGKLALAVVAGLLVGGASVFAATSVPEFSSQKAEKVVVENVEAVQAEEAEAEAAKAEAAAAEAQKEAEAVSEPSGITLDEAKKIALAEVSGADSGDIVKAHEDRDDGRVEFDVEIHHDGLEHEFEIDAETGKIFDKDVDRIGD